MGGVGGWLSGCVCGWSKHAHTHTKHAIKLKNGCLHWAGRCIGVWVAWSPQIINIINIHTESKYLN